MSTAQPNGAQGAHVTTPTRDFVRPDEPGFELSEEWLARTPWCSQASIYGGSGNDFETLEKRELTAIKLASSLVSEAARTLPWGSEWGEWLRQMSAHIYREGRKLEVARAKAGDPHIGYLSLPDAVDELLRSEGIETISQLAVIDEHGGLQSVSGIVAALEEWRALPDDEISVGTARMWKQYNEVQGEDAA